jgi:hypothetical protein
MMRSRGLSALQPHEKMHRVVLISWYPDRQGFAAECLDALTGELTLMLGRDHLVYEDPTKLGGENKACAIRQRRDEATDFAAIVNREYLLHASEQGGDSDLYEFVKRRIMSDDQAYNMWLFPLHLLNLDRYAFFSKLKAPATPIENLDFHWWHGKEKIPPPNEPGATKQRFDDEIALRARLIVDHPDGCKVCHLPK